MLNPFFLNGTKAEQGLMQDLVNESIRMYGIEVYYLPRQYVNERTIIKEVIDSKFNFAYPIEAYIGSYDGYGGQGTILSKFGIQELDDLTLIISQERFHSYIAPLIENLPDVKLAHRPKEGDLIYFPLGDRLFEIKYVEHEKPFYQLQKNYVYELTCELFRYEDEVIDTNIEFIDDNIKDVGYIQSFQMIGRSATTVISTNPITNYAAGVNVVCLNSVAGIVIGDFFTAGDNNRIEIIGISSNCITLKDGLQFAITNTTPVYIERLTGSNATATSTIVNGGVRYVTILNRGVGYVSTPKIVFSNAPPGGITASAEAVMISGIVDFCDSDPNLKRIQQIQITNAGAGYTVPPKISVIGGGGSGFKGEAVLGNGIIGVVSITNPGSGYSSPPAISFAGTSIVSAAATAIVSNSGSISSIRVTNSGLGYTTPNNIQISPSNLMIGIGAYLYNEVVTGSVSNITARVKYWNSGTKILKVSNLTGNFKVGENLIGSKSGAIYTLGSINIENLPDPLSKVDTRDKYPQNDQIEKEADEILDFDETNPFGTP